MAKYFTLLYSMGQARSCPVRTFRDSGSFHFIVLLPLVLSLNTRLKLGQYHLHLSAIYQDKLEKKPMFKRTRLNLACCRSSGEQWVEISGREVIISCKIISRGVGEEAETPGEMWVFPSDI